jgi:Predicted Fe-S oxidoreductases
MCYICGQDDPKSLLSKELSTAQWIEIGKQARDAGVLYLLLTGGEIFIRKDFFEIYEALMQMGLIVTLYTNGTLINDDIIKRLTEIPPYLLSITLYGSNPDAYGKVTGHPEAYEKVVRNVKKLVDAGINTELKTTIIKCNSMEYEELAELAWSFGIGLRIVNYISPSRKGTGMDPLTNRLEPLELVEFEKNAGEFAEKLYKKAKDSKEDVRDLIADDIMSGDYLESSIKKTDTPPERKLAFRCSAGRYGFWISWDGKMFPCGMLSEISADALKNGFDGAWHEIKEVCANIPLCQECNNCSYYSRCTICPARSKSETGSFDTVAPYICEYTKARDQLYVSC